MSSALPYRCLGCKQVMVPTVSGGVGCPTLGTAGCVKDTGPSAAGASLDKQLLLLSQADPTLRKCQQEEGMSFEDALKLAIVSLHQQNVALREQLTDALLWSTKPTH